MPGDTRPRCPICRQGVLRPGLDTGRVAISRCTLCAHRVARHVELAPSVAGVDYHRQYETGTFVEALQATRRRQGRSILAHVRRLVPGAGGLVDFGAGLGWFLEEARAAGFGALAGIDTSVVAVEFLTASGIEAITTPPLGQHDTAIGFDRLSFHPTVLTFLDVIEHFPPDRALPMIRNVVAEAGPELELIVIKVPLSTGVLYRIAAALTHLGRPALLDQLYQAGTHPPHLSYFSPRSLRKLVEPLELRPVLELRDLDFEPSWLHSRVHALHAFPSPLVTMCAWTLAGSIRAIGGEDATILFIATARWRGTRTDASP